MAPRYRKSREKNTDALNGDAAHSLGKRWIKAKAIEPAADVVGTASSNGVIHSMGIYESAAIYTSVVLDMFEGAKYAGCEDTILATGIHDRCKGDVDAWAYHESTGTLIVADFKNGFVSVDAEGNWQLSTYAIGLINFLRIKKYEVLHIEFVIIQPNSYTSEGPVKRWITTPLWLEERREVLEAQALIATSDNPPTHSGPHCKNCNGRHACEALKDSMSPIVTMIRDSTPWELTPEEVGRELAILQSCKELLSARLSGLETEALSLLKSGTPVNGFATKVGRGSLKWAHSPAEVLAIASASGYDVSKPAQVITPTQAKAAKVPEILVDGLSERTLGAIKLVKDDCSEAKRIFSKEK